MWNALNIFKDIFRLDRGQTSFPLQLFPPRGKSGEFFSPFLFRFYHFPPPLSSFLEVFPGRERVSRMQKSPTRDRD